MAALLPQVKLKGLFKVKPPFKLEEATAYECSAVVLHNDFSLKGIDVFSTYYDVYKLTKTEYQEDVANGGAIVTLKSPGLPSVTLPSSYITEFPSGAMVPYNLYILSTSITVPDGVDFTALIESMQTMVEGNFGIKDADVNITHVPTLSYMTVDDAKIAESNRVAAITDKDTLRSENKRLADKNASLSEQVEALTEALIQANK